MQVFLQLPFQQQFFILLLPNLLQFRFIFILQRLIQQQFVRLQPQQLIQLLWSYFFIVQLLKLSVLLILSIFYHLPLIKASILKLLKKLLFMLAISILQQSTSLFPTLPPLQQFLLFQALLFDVTAPAHSIFFFLHPIHFSFILQVPVIFIQELLFQDVFSQLPLKHVIQPLYTFYQPLLVLFWFFLPTLFYHQQPFIQLILFLTS